MRRALFWSHLAVGITAGAVVLVMSVTGVLLAYERQLTEWADGHRVRPPVAGTPRLAVETLLARVVELRGEAPSTVTVRADPAMPVAFALGREATVFADPYSGRVLGEGSARARAFFRTVTAWHRWLGAPPGEGRAAMRSVTGASNLLFLLLVASGLLLWWPRGLTPRHLRPVTLFQSGLRGRARDFNWHNVVGFWSAVPLAAIVASGVVISYPWANEFVHRLAGSVPPPRSAGPGSGPGARPGSTAGRVERPRPSAADWAGLDAAWTRAEARAPGWQTLSARLPASSSDPWVIMIDTSRGARRPDTRAQLALDRRTGAEVGFETYARRTPGRRAVGWLRFVHTGEAFGVAGQTVAGLASVGATLLVWTGLSLAWGRLQAFLRRQA